MFYEIFLCIWGYSLVLSSVEYTFLPVGKYNITWIYKRKKGANISVYEFNETSTSFTYTFNNIIP